MKPAKIRIMADYGDAYAWDEKGRNIGISYSFEDHPRYADIRSVESELEKWSVAFGDAEDDDPGFPWDKFNDEGRALAVRLSELLMGSGIRIVYTRPYEDPGGKGLKEEWIA